LEAESEESVSAFFLKERNNMKFCLRFLAFIIILSVLCGILVGCKEEESTEAPEFRNLLWAINTVLPTAQDFVVSLPDEATVKFAEEYVFQSIGSYEIVLIVTDGRGKENQYTVNFELIDDKENPKISGATDISTYVGDGISYRSGVTVSDNCDGKIVLDIDSSAVDNMTEGVYPVTYTATDAAGNSSTVEISVYVYRERVTLDDLFAMLDPIIASRIPTSGSAEMQAREVYTYVYNHIDYDSYSDKSDWVRAAYEGLRTGKGDCYTYFALSKAFFERLGIQNMNIQRTSGIVDERHYWNFINIGTADSPRWYHFDACRLSGIQHSGCLLTDLQVDAYTRQRVDENGIKNYFYAYNKSDYPSSADQIITDTPTLEPYY
jgi:hypothetical protein